MTDRLDRIEAILEQTARQQQVLTEKVDRLTERVDRLTEVSSNLASGMETLQRVLTLEISEFKANFLAIERRIEQIEERIQQIWQYLLDQFRSRGNGHGEGDNP